MCVVVYDLGDLGCCFSCVFVVVVVVVINDPAVAGDRPSA